jgi:branched-chain amino acid transport system ATP-binding protein
MTAMLLSIVDLTKRYGGLAVTQALNLDILEGETHALIGPNGAGKTTLIAQIQGDLAPDDGRILFAGADITATPTHRRAQLGIARTFQITSVFPEFSVLLNLALAGRAATGHRLRLWKQVENDEAVLAPARFVAGEVGLADRLAAAARDLSHGERRQLELGIAMVMKPRLLLLDEPMAGMGRQDCAKIERLLGGLKRSYTMLLVEHDMDAVFSLADRITVLVSGQIVTTGTPEQIRSDPRVRDAYLGDGSAG